MSKPRPARKTVSFQRLDNEDIRSTRHKEVNVFPVISTPALLIPVHTVGLIAGLFQLGLAQSPREWLVKGLFYTMALQLAYGAFILHASGPRKQKKADAGTALVLMFSLLATVVFSVPGFAALILMGAPLASHLVETYLLAVHLLLVAVFPVLVYFRLDFDLLGRVFEVERVSHAVLHNQVLSSSFFAVVGTWLGVIPIPLDWDRPWQQWPITLLVGGYAGAFVGGLVSLVASQFA